jgi:hypothetical protein
MGGIRRLSASSLEERNSMGVGTFQPSFGFKDFLNRFTKHELPHVKVTGEVSVSRRRRNPSARSALLSGAPLA